MITHQSHCLSLYLSLPGFSLLTHIFTVPGPLGPPRACDWYMKVKRVERGWGSLVEGHVPSCPL